MERKYTVSTGKCNNNTLVKKGMTAFELKELIRKPSVAQIGEDEVRAFKEKNMDAMIMGELKGNQRGGQHAKNRSGIALDLEDKVEEITPEVFDGIKKRLEDMGIMYLYYTTLTATEEHPRLRVIFPLKRDIKAAEYQPYALYMAKKLGVLNYLDRSSVNPVQLQGMPVKIMDGYYEYGEAIKFDPIDPDALLEEMIKEGIALDDATTYPWPDEVLPPSTNSKGKVWKDPTTKDNIVGAFCRTYTVQEAIEEFLPDVYRFIGVDNDGNPTYHFLRPRRKSSDIDTAGRIIQDGLAFQAFNANDPVVENNGGGPTSVNAFDLVRLHKFNPKGIDYKETAEEKRKESFRLMAQYVTGKLGKERPKRWKEIKDLEKQLLLDKAGREQAERFASEATDVTDDERNELLALYSRLERDEKSGKILGTSTNVKKILNEDPRIKDRIYYDTFAQRIMVRDYLPWHNREEDKIPAMWTDFDDAELRSFLREGYGFRSKDETYDALVSYANANKVNPVKDFVTAVEWDGVPRVDTIFIDYFGCDDNVYTREAGRKFLLGALKRLYEPGAKVDCVPVLSGPGGTGKSTFAHKLAGPYHKDDDLQFNGRKEDLEVLENAFIVEIQEIRGYAYDLNIVKSFLTRRTDSYRRAYDRRKSEIPRRCVFIATSNDVNYLREDGTGNRRFWPLVCKNDFKRGIHSKKHVFEDLTTEEVHQIWSEALVYYRAGEADGNNLYLSPEAEEICDQQRERSLFEDPEQRFILNYLLSLFPVGWDKMSKESKREWLMNRAEMEDVQPLELREYISTTELNFLCFNNPKVDKGASRRFGKILSRLRGVEKMNKTIYFGDGLGFQQAYRISPDFFLEYGKEIEAIQEYLVEDDFELL